MQDSFVECRRVSDSVDIRACVWGGWGVALRRPSSTRTAADNFDGFVYQRVLEVHRRYGSLELARGHGNGVYNVGCPTVERCILRRIGGPPLRSGEKNRVHG